MKELIFLIYLNVSAMVFGQRISNIQLDQRIKATELDFKLILYIHRCYDLLGMFSFLFMFLDMVNVAIVPGE